MVVHGAGIFMSVLDGAMFLGSLNGTSTKLYKMLPPFSATAVLGMMHRLLGHGARLNKIQKHLSPKPYSNLVM